MDINIEIQNLKDGQEKILKVLKESTTCKNDLKVYSLDAMAEFFGVTKRTIYNWKDEGILPVTIIGSKTYVTSGQLENFLKENEVKPLKYRRFNHV